MSAAAADRIVELEIERVTEGLDLADRAELDSLVSRHGDVGRDGFELAAAAVELSFVRELEEMPASLRERLERQAEAFVADRGRSSEAPEPPEASILMHPSARESGEGRSRDVLPWLLAAAALVAAVLGWARPGVDAVDLPVETRTATLGLDDQRARLLEAGGDVQQIAWTATDDDAARGVEGDVVWSTERQHGFMRFRGLPANDPGTLQYQLWIFDATRDERHPVDGGVFDVGDVAEDGEILVPIAAKLAIRQPTLFAVTIEPPGGVVVSNRERIVTLATVG